MLNRSLRIALERNPAQSTSSTPTNTQARRQDFQATIELVKPHARDLAIGGVGIYAAVKAISTLSEIAIKLTPKH